MKLFERLNLKDPSHKEKSRFVGTVILAITFFLGFLIGNHSNKSRIDQLENELAIWRKRQPLLEKLFSENSKAVKQLLLAEEDLLKLHDHAMLLNNKVRQINLIHQKAQNKHRKSIGLPEKDISSSGLYDPIESSKDLIEDSEK